MTTPIYARQNPNNTVNVLDGTFVGAKFALETVDSGALSKLTEIATGIDVLAPANKPNYAFTFSWTDGKLTTINRTADSATEFLTLTYDGNGNLATISNWQATGA